MWETTKFRWYDLLCVARSFILRVADPVRKILSFWRWPSCHPRGQGFIQHGSKVKSSRPDFRQSSDQQRPIIIRTYTKPGTCSGYLPPPQKLGFLEKINMPWAKSLLLKSQQLWEPRLFPGPPWRHRATVPWNYGGIPPCSSFPKQQPEVQVLEKQVPVILVLKGIKAGKPLPSRGVLSLNTERIRRSLETNLMNMQATTAKSVGTVKHPMTFKPFLKPAHMQGQEMVERNINDQILEIPDPCHDDINRLSITAKLLPVPSRAPSRTAGVISPSQALSASTTPDPFTLLKDTRESPNRPDPLFSSTPLHSPPSPLMPLPGGNRSRSSPLNQRAHKANVRCLNLQQLLPPLALKASAKAPQTPAQSILASALSKPVSDVISPVPGQARLQATRRLRTSRAKCTLACTWTLSTATSDTLKSAAPAPANDTANALEPKDTSSSELIPASFPSVSVPRGSVQYQAV
ncbi:hypothetical protein GJAV_G00218650 [Gymnothorax javanicus]|nr:hypothetical protein GJAV_G00218650 [Gymnothorax javanicus]